MRKKKKQKHNNNVDVFAVSVNKELLKWINENYESLGFRNRSHFVEFVISKYKESVK